MFKHSYNTDIIVYRCQKIISIFSQNTKKRVFRLGYDKKAKKTLKKV